MNHILPSYKNKKIRDYNGRYLTPHRYDLLAAVWEFLHAVSLLRCYEVCHDHNYVTVGLRTRGHDLGHGPNEKRQKIDWQYISCLGMDAYTSVQDVILELIYCFGCAVLFYLCFIF